MGPWHARPQRLDRLPTRPRLPHQHCPLLQYLLCRVGTTLYAVDNVHVITHDSIDTMCVGNHTNTSFE